jgi:membrane protease YdiL (CAAX protease family)
VRYRTNSIGSAIIAHGVINAPAAIFVMFGLPELPGMTP